VSRPADEGYEGERVSYEEEAERLDLSPSAVEMARWVDETSSRLTSSIQIAFAMQPPRAGSPEDRILDYLSRFDWARFIQRRADVQDALVRAARYAPPRITLPAEVLRADFKLTDADVARLFGADGAKESKAP
jgi:hypothetical protein